MLSNFHTHTYLCKHAEGTPLDYVRQARGAVIRTLTERKTQEYKALYANTQMEKLLFDKALEGLIREGFVAEQDGCYSISK